MSGCAGPTTSFYPEGDATMKRNEYESAEVCEIGKAEIVILGEKSAEPWMDSSGEPPLDRLYVE